MKDSPLRGNVPNPSHTSRNFQSAAVFQALDNSNLERSGNPMQRPLQRPFALSFTVGAILYAAVSVLTLIALHNATSNGRAAMNSGYGITTSGQ
jgi:hypothetical protein